MKLLLFFIALLATANFVYADENVKGYYKKDGTFVPHHKRSNPDDRRYNNYSSEGEKNPYTGKKGHQRNELSAKPVRNKKRHKFPKKLPDQAPR